MTSDIDGGVAVVDGDGSVAWRVALNETDLDDTPGWDAPVVAAFDADRRPEVLVGSNGGPAMLSAAGTVEWTRDGPGTYVAAARTDGDTAIELFAADTSSVRAYDGASGATEWTRPLTNGRVRTVTDADDDGAVELYVGRTGGAVLTLDARTGGTEWSTDVSGDDDVVVAPPSLGDVDGDGRPEVIAATDGGVVAVLDAVTGAELAAYEWAVPIWTFATPADVDDDGRAEVLVRYGDGRVVALDYAS